MPDVIKKVLQFERRKQLRILGYNKAKIQEQARIPSATPKALAMRYSAFLSSFQNGINAQLYKQIKPLIDAIELRQDSIEDDIDLLMKGLLELVERFLSVETLVFGVTKQGNDISLFNSKKYSKPLFRIIGLNDLPTGRERTILSGWTRRNLELIKNVNVEQVAKLKTVIYQGAQTGSRAKDLEAKVQKIMKSSPKRAKLIARDQTMKLNGQLDRTKQTNAGIDHYIWRTSLDGKRVRPAHRDREGKRYSWNKEPPGGDHPGQAVLCRCRAEPDLSDVLGDFSQAA